MDKERLIDYFSRIHKDANTIYTKLEIVLAEGNNYLPYDVKEELCLLQHIIGDIQYDAYRGKEELTDNENNDGQ